jgi:UrcA family protein
MNISHALLWMAVAAVPVPTLAQDSSGEIVVTAPRHGKRDASGTPTETVSHATKVKYGDLDLSTPGGRQTLDARLAKAAQTSCRWLDAHYPVVDRENDCETAALADAKSRLPAGAR